MDTAAVSQPGARADFSQVVASTRADLCRYARRLSGHPQLAEDLVQDSLARAWRFLPRLREPEAARAWLFTILRREHARHCSRTQEACLPEPIERAASAETYDTSTEAFALRRALRDLPEAYREPLLLQVLHGYSQQDIADRLGISSAGIGTRLHRARARLRAALGERT